MKLASSTVFSARSTTMCPASQRTLHAAVLVGEAARSTPTVTLGWATPSAWRNQGGGAASYG